MSPDMSFPDVVLALGVGASLGALFGVILAVKTRESRHWVIAAVFASVGVALIVLSKIPAVVG